MNFKEIKWYWNHIPPLVRMFFSLILLFVFSLMFSIRTFYISSGFMLFVFLLYFFLVFYIESP